MLPYIVSVNVPYLINLRPLFSPISYKNYINSIAELNFKIILSLKAVGNVYYTLLIRFPISVKESKGDICYEIPPYL